MTISCPNTLRHYTGMQSGGQLEGSCGEVLHAIEDETSHEKAAADTRGLLHQFQSFEFLLAIVVLKQLLEHTNVVSRYLQFI